MNQGITKLITNLEKNNMAGYFVNNNEELLNLISELIIKGSSVGSGDSITLENTGVFKFLRNGNYRFLDKFNPSLSKELAK